jgi:glycosyltransferase involved in cell wall biosynthesis
MTPQRLRIAVIGPRGIPSTYSGIERVAESLYAELAARGHAITVYCRPEYVPGGSQRYRGLTLQRSPALRGRALGTLSHVASSTVHALAGDRFDVIHLHALAPSLLAPLSTLRRVPTVATVQGLDWQRAKWKGVGALVLRQAERSMVRYVDEIIAVSHDLERYFHTRYGRRTVHIPNGTDVTPANGPVDPALLKRFGLRPHEYVLFVARLVPEKRVEDLIQAFRLTKTPFRLALVGESSHTDAYAARLRRLAAGDARIVFTGTQPREQLDMLFRAAAVFVLPSELEGMSMALLQSLEMGIPAVVSDLPVHRELLDHIAGYDLFFPPGDVVALSDRLARALAHLHEYREVADRVQHHIRASYGWPAIAERTEALYYALAARRRHPMPHDADAVAESQRVSLPKQAVGGSQ